MLPRFIGVINQIPPTYSAIKIAGERAYDLARDGAEFEIAAREIVVHRLDLVSCDRDEATFEAECGKGAYVRAIARDLGRALGCLGHVVLLRRDPRRPVLRREWREPRGACANRRKRARPRCCLSRRACRSWRACRSIAPAPRHCGAVRNCCCAAPRRPAKGQPTPSASASRSLSARSRAVISFRRGYSICRTERVRIHAGATSPRYAIFDRQTVGARYFRARLLPGRHGVRDHAFPVG